ncbi:39S ribosomal protein L43, mitochondrial isoform X1 [Chiloscyllium plagiosum]|uniref:39S ribosomal protein L43, mitochondrial isoform X1 n=1 Tax=Chiloscyllium plagiosum TaxID=36176 RepID=UPI001CB85127|nr:39S ribosomal protein L43, mitochondrial isoform X1 [Chiloscyllium plagiosum]
MTARGSASRFLQSVLQNGVGRYICQLKRITLVFSKDAPSSRGVREFIEEGVVDFAKQNPGVVMYVTAKQCNVPKLVGEYLLEKLHTSSVAFSLSLMWSLTVVNGSMREEPLNRKTAEQVGQLIQKMASQSGLDIIRIRKPYHTDNPSIQSQWTPFTNKPSVLNMHDFEQVKGRSEDKL